MAGTGKSAVARSFCYLLREKDLFGGSFFCLRGDQARENVRRILPTLAWDLAHQDAQYQEDLLRVFKSVPDIANHTIEGQINYLLTTAMKPPFRVFVIDALDECADHKDAKILLEKLLSISLELRVKFFITSRPEAHIRSRFATQQSHAPRILRLHDIQQHVVEADISLYLIRRLNAIRFSSDVPEMFPPDWPAASDVKALTRLAGKLFIYAFTAVQYIEEYNHVERLDTLAKFTVDDDGVPFYGPLDTMYGYILSAALDPKKCRKAEISRTKEILAILLAIREPLALSDLAKLLGVTPPQIRVNLGRIHAVVRVPPPGQDGHGVVSVFHKSFVDFLTTPGRAPKSQLILLSLGHRDLTQRSMAIMSTDLHFNISQCKTSYLPNSRQQLATISESLKYSCFNWAYHLTASDDTCQVFLNPLEELLLQKFLFWLEVLSVVGAVGLASSIILRAFTGENTRYLMSRRLNSFLSDANDFIISFREVIELSAPHIYLSALPCLRRTSRISEIFRPLFPNTIDLTVKGIERRQRTLMDLRGHTAAVKSICLRPWDCSRIVSGSLDGTIRVWDAVTGEEVMKAYKLLPDTSIHSVCFSPDGKYIVSGSSDGRIRVLAVLPAELITEVLTLAGHSAPVTCVAFSPDGRHIASSSLDTTVRIWDILTGKGISTIRHSFGVYSVCFSSSASHIVSCARGNTVQMWDARTGEHVWTQIVYGVTCFSLSPDGEKFITGSGAELHLWNWGVSGYIRRFVGNAGGVHSVAFSPDGCYVVSGSQDNTVRLWDIQTGAEVVEPFEGHVSSVLSVSFSKDGSRIVSGSADKTIRVWDAHKAKETKSPIADHIRYIDISADGKYILSGSDTIKVMDSRTGAGLWKEHVLHLSSVRFSLDAGRSRIVSGSSDGCVTVWVTITGEKVMRVRLHGSAIRCVGFSLDGTCIFGVENFCPGRDSIFLLEAKTGEGTVTLLDTDLGCPISSVCSSPDGRFIVSNSLKLKVSDDASWGETEPQLSGTMAPRRRPRMRPDTFVTAVTALWDVTTGKRVVRDGPLFKPHQDHFDSVYFSPDGSRIVCDSSDDTIRIWDVNTGEEVMTLHDTKLKSGNSCFSPDGTRIICGTISGAVRLWDVRTGKAVMKLEGHASPIHSLRLSADGSQLMSLSKGNIIRVWDMRFTETVMAMLPDFGEHVLPEIGYTNNLVLKLNYQDSRPPTMLNFCLIPLPTHDNGWMTGPNGELIFWVPSEYRSCLVLPPCTLLIGESQAILDPAKFVHGVEWAKCWCDD